MFYSITILPETMQRLILFNPIAVIVEAFRSVVIYGQPPDYTMLSIYTIISFVVAFLGFSLFKRMSRGFADVV